MAGVAGRSGRKPGFPGVGGRPPGVPNKATTAAREAIAKFVDGNAHRLQKWLDEVADGKPALGPDGKQLRNEAGLPIWLVPPNPEKASSMFQALVEYHVPKLARSELTGPNGGPVSITAIDLKGLSDAELEQVQRLLGKAAQ